MPIIIFLALSNILFIGLAAYYKGQRDFILGRIRSNRNKKYREEDVFDESGDVSLQK